MDTKKKNIDAYLAEIFKQFVAIKDDDLKTSQEVFRNVFDVVKSKMADNCNYFKKFSSQTFLSGSVYDGVKVTKMDEFDMDIVIRLPINQTDDSKKGVILENDLPGFVKMKIIDGFDHLDKQPDWEKCNVVTKEWRDPDKYFLQSKFRHWMHGVVQMALNDLDGKVVIHGATYLLTYKETGPAFTLLVRNEVNEEHLHVDVDLVPVIKFVLPRWPEGYRKIKDSNIKEWFLVPKPNKLIKDKQWQNRCWRLSFQDFEKEMMKDRQQLKTTLRLMKKLRNALEMKGIASYYIKTLFLWKIDENNDKKYWQTKISALFHTMVKVLYDAVEKKCIPYFWNKNNNLLETLKPGSQKVYLDRLAKVLKSIESNDVDAVTASLLTDTELQLFKNSDFCKPINKEESNDQLDLGSAANPVLLDDNMRSMREDVSSDIIERLISLEERVKVLEMSVGLCKH